MFTSLSCVSWLNVWVVDCIWLAWMTFVYTTCKGCWAGLQDTTFPVHFFNRIRWSPWTFSAALGLDLLKRLKMKVVILGFNGLKLTEPPPCSIWEKKLYKYKWVSSSCGGLFSKVRFGGWKIKSQLRYRLLLKACHLFRLSSNKSSILLIWKLDTFEQIMIDRMTPVCFSPSFYWI